MKNIIPLLLAIVLLVASCRKDKKGKGSGSDKEFEKIGVQFGEEKMPVSDSIEITVPSITVSNDSLDYMAAHFETGIVAINYPAFKSQAKATDISLYKKYIDKNFFSYILETKDSVGNSIYFLQTVKRSEKDTAPLNDIIGDALVLKNDIPTDYYFLTKDSVLYVKPNDKVITKIAY